MTWLYIFVMVLLILASGAALSRVQSRQPVAIGSSHPFTVLLLTIVTIVAIVTWLAIT